MGAALVQYIVSMKKLPERARTVNNPLPAGRRPLVALAALGALAAIGGAVATDLLRAVFVGPIGGSFSPRSTTPRTSPRPVGRSLRSELER